MRTDGRENLITALEIAAAEKDGQAMVPEVCILFGAKLFRGNRTTKVDAERFDAFQSFNYPPLAEIGIHIHYNEDAIVDAPFHGGVEVFDRMDTHVAVLKLFPGIRPEIMDAVIRTPGLRGLILESYGAGNAPTSDWFLARVKEAEERGIVVYNVTQCQGGSVEMGRYETSRGLIGCGVVSGYDSTIEAAVCKLMYLLACFSDVNEVKKIFKYTFKG